MLKALKLLLFVDVKVRTELTESEIEQRIKLRMAFVDQFTFSSKNEYRQFEGAYSNGAFRFRRVLKNGRNSFIPFVHGIVETKDNSINLVNIRIKFNNVVYLLIGFLAFLFSFDPSIAGGVFFLLTYLVSLFFFNIELQLIERELKTIFETSDFDIA